MPESMHEQYQRSLFRRWPGFLAVLFAFVPVAAAAPAERPLRSPPMAKPPNYEVWAIDQSDTTADGGGTLRIYPRAAVLGRAATFETIDLGGEARSFCLARTGSAPRRPHMIMFNHAQTHAIVAFVATGHVLFLDARSRRPVGCVDVGLQAHAANASSTGRYVLVANQNGKLLQRITTNYRTNTFTLDEAATLNLATCRTPSGAACQDAALRPDNAPIFAIPERSSRLGFVTLRGGGMLVVRSAETPMAVHAEYDKATISPNGFGAFQAGDKMYVNSGGGTSAAPLRHNVYVFSLGGFGASSTAPNTPAPRLVYSHDSRGFVDSHGAVVTKPMSIVKRIRRGGKMRRVRVTRGPYLWVGDRAANHVVVVDTKTDKVVSEIPLARASGSDPAPDLMEISPAGDRVFIALRGPTPLTGNVPGVDNAVGSTPGVAVVRVLGQGRTGVLERILSMSRVVDGVERADPHAVAVRRTR